MHWKRQFFLGAILVLCLGTAACSNTLFKAYGRIDPTPEATQAFEGYQVNPDYRYYISGADLNPNAFMGLERKYQLDPSALWREVEMSAAKMKEIVNGMKTKAYEHRMFQYGFVISDNNGRPIGLWYSLLEGRTFVRMNEDGTVRIDAPELDLYMKLENDGRDGN